MIVSDILSKKEDQLLTTTPDTQLNDAIDLLNTHNIGSLLVLEDDTLVGIITERDILRATGENMDRLSSLKVRDLMTTDLVICSPEMALAKVEVLMTGERIRHLPVMQDEKLVGLISIGDVVKARLQESEAEAEELKNYIRTGR